LSELQLINNHNFGALYKPHYIKCSDKDCYQSEIPLIGKLQIVNGRQALG